MAVSLDDLPPTETGDLVDVLLSASRALVAVAVRSLGGYEGTVTLAQYRVLVILCSRGPQRVVDLAGALGVSPPNATRICGRLSRNGLVRRSRSSTDRRSVRVSVTAEGRQVVAHVTTARRSALDRIVARMDPGDGERLVAALREFTTAAGETPDGAWALGWGV